MVKEFLERKGWRYEPWCGMWFKPRAPYDENEEFFKVCAEQGLYGHHVEEAIIKEAFGWHIARSSWMAVVVGVLIWVTLMAIFLAVIGG